MKINRFFSDVLGATLKNQRWSWGATDPMTNRIYLRIWRDEIRSFGGADCVPLFWHDITGPGAAERGKHLSALRAGAEGFGVICEAVDPETRGARSIAAYDDAQLLVLGELVERGNAIWARIDDRISIEQLSRPRSGQSTLAADVQSILRKPNVTSTQKEALINARLGQGAFRYQVLALWNNKCAVTGCGISEVLRASHIKPWRDCTDDERLDANNGLPLSAHFDALFDCGLITFEDSGKLLVSRQLPLRERRLLGVAEMSLRNKPSLGMLRYLDHHRDKLFR